MRDATSAGQLIRDRLYAMGETQAWLASAVQVTEKHLSRVLTGASAFSPMVAVRIEQATGLDADTLITAQGRVQVAAARAQVPDVPS